MLEIGSKEEDLEGSGDLSRVVVLKKKKKKSIKEIDGYKGMHTVNICEESLDRLVLDILNTKSESFMYMRYQCLLRKQTDTLHFLHTGNRSVHNTKIKISTILLC